MIYFVGVFLCFATISFIWCLAAFTLNRFRFGTASKRAALMFVVWLGFAVLLHVLMRTSREFYRGLPVVVLNMDLRFPVYGRDAILELLRRAREGTTGRDDWQETTAILLGNSWWTHDLEGAIPGPTDELVHPVDLWFSHLLMIESLPAEQFHGLLLVDPPPIFDAPDRVEVEGSGLAASARYGRQWVAEYNLPYEITRIEIDEVRLNGESVDFELTQAPDSEADLGRYAHKVLWFIQGLPQPVSAGEMTLEIDYRLWAEPGRYADIGPLRWSKVIRVE